MSAPPITVVVPTHDRPELVRRALATVADQEYAAPVEAVVVFDRSEPDHSLTTEFPTLPVRVVVNDRTPGLCGARNTGILAAGTEWVAFLDDDDEWLPGKLTAQAQALAAEPDAEFCSTSMVVRFGDADSERLAGRDRVTYPDLLRSRMAMLHSSSFLARRSALLDGVGLLDEDLPGSMCEDWDILLRAARRRPIVHVDRPLVRVYWGATSYFSQRWTTKLAAWQAMLDKHPDIATSRVGAARVHGQMAFAHAALKQRGAAVRSAGRAARYRWREPRGVLALAVASGAVSAPRVLEMLHRRGHGI